MSKRAFLVTLLMLGIVIGTVFWFFRSPGGQTVSFRSAAVTRGDIRSFISATGTIEPEEVIDVGAQVAGQITSFGRDVEGRTIDYGSIVEKGMVLAKIDDSLYAAEAAQAEAQLKAARAGCKRAEADVQQAKARLGQAERDWRRAQRIGSTEALSEASYDAYRASYEVAKANLAVAEASVDQARSSVAQAEALLHRAQLNLGYCTIRSPVDGIIIDRRVNIGQTVVSSFNAPSLFLFAKDLRRMQVWVAVNEADIGKIRCGQHVTFTVDAFPGESFTGEVGKVRLNASMTQNVVTYTVEVIIDNSDGRLLPYLTANVQFELGRLSNVLRVPNSALRWSPMEAVVLPEFRNVAGSTAVRKDNRPRIEGAKDVRPSAPADGMDDQKVVWLAQGPFVKPVTVRAGLTDGSMTAIESDELSEGMEVVIGVVTPSGVGAGPNGSGEPQRTPFMPKLPPPPGGP